MKKIGTKLALHRETLQRLDDAPMSEVRGGIFTYDPPQSQPSGCHSCTCTLVC
jgi:hypothetical protein